MTEDKSREDSTVTNTDYYLHILRNPYGYSEEHVRDARLYMADAFERALKELSEVQAAMRPEIDKLFECQVERGNYQAELFAVRQQLAQANETIKQLKRTINEIVTRHTNT